MVATVELVHPREVAKFRDMVMPVLESERAKGDSKLLTKMFGAKATIEGARIASPVQFMQGLFAALGDVMSSVTWQSMEIVRSVREGEFAHAVVRLRISLGSLSTTQMQMQILSLRPYQGQWRVMLTGEMEGLASALQARASR